MRQQEEVVGVTQRRSTRTNRSSLCESQGLIENLFKTEEFRLE